MTIYFGNCSPEDGYGAPCGYCSKDVCCYEHWKEHAQSAHKEQWDADEKRNQELVERLSHHD